MTFYGGHLFSVASGLSAGPAPATEPSRLLAPELADGEFAPRSAAFENTVWCSLQRGSLLWPQVYRALSNQHLMFPATHTLASSPSGMPLAVDLRSLVPGQRKGLRRVAVLTVALRGKRKWSPRGTGASVDVV